MTQLRDQNTRQCSSIALRLSVKRHRYAAVTTNYEKLIYLIYRETA